MATVCPSEIRSARKTAPNPPCPSVRRTRKIGRLGVGTTNGVVSSGCSATGGGVPWAAQTGAASRRRRPQVGQRIISPLFLTRTSPLYPPRRMLCEARPLHVPSSSTGGAPGLTPLPIDAAIPAIVKAVEADGAVVVEAPPGAGKTTRVPSALLDAAPAGRPARFWVLEPRRLPARLAAARVAAERGERVGETVGYSVRFDEAGGPRTRLRFMTEGLFVRRLLADPELRGVSAVVLDELHERHVATDLALAWLRRLREGARPDLAVVAMSATLEAEPVRAFLAGDAAPGDHRAERRAEVRRRDRAPAGGAGRATTARSSGGSRGRSGSSCARSPTATCWSFFPAPARSGARRPRSPSFPRQPSWPFFPCTARCRSRSRRAPCDRPGGARWSWRRTSPNRR